MRWIRRTSKLAVALAMRLPPHERAYLAAQSALEEFDKVVRLRRSTAEQVREPDLARSARLHAHVRDLIRLLFQLGAGRWGRQQQPELGMRDVDRALRQMQEEYAVVEESQRPVALGNRITAYVDGRLVEDAEETAACLGMRLDTLSHTVRLARMSVEDGITNGNRAANSITTARARPRGMRRPRPVNSKIFVILARIRRPTSGR